MSILTGFKKQKKYSTDANGDHKLVSTWTHADTVEVGNDGAVLSDVFEYDANYQEVTMQQEGYNTVDGGSQIKIKPGALGNTYRKRDSDNHIVEYNSVVLNPRIMGRGAILNLKSNFDSTDCEMQARAYDINLSGTYNGDDNTWDGTNTSLKNAITSLKDAIADTAGYHVTKAVSSDGTGEEMLFTITDSQIATALGLSSFDLYDYYISTFWFTIEQGMNPRYDYNIFYNTDTTDRFITVEKQNDTLYITMKGTQRIEDYRLHFIFKPIPVEHDIIDTPV